jgi:glyoxylase I family protein
VTHIYKTIEYLKEKDIIVEEIRIDEYTGKKFTFIVDPDGLPIELYER